MQISKFILVAWLVGTASMAEAVTVKWASLTAQPNATTVTGTVDGVALTYTGSINFTQLNNTGTDFWVDLGYTQGVVNRPTGTDLISLADAGAKTITFAKPLKDLYVAFTSWNGNSPTFSAPFTVVSEGCGFWGCGTFNPNMAGTGFSTSQEVHGVLRFAGNISSLTFTNTFENWHGFTVGTTGAVPEPANWAMLIAGFGLIGASMRRRRVLAAA